jgi:hypothetical protein
MIYPAAGVEGNIMTSRAGWLFAAFLFLAAPAAAAPAVGGVYVIVNAHQPAQFSDVTKAAARPGVDGLLIHVRWDKLSDGYMHYKWAPLDTAIAIATQKNKRFEIGLQTEGALPGWITAPVPAGVGAAHATFEVNATVGSGCQTLVIVPPYDAAYLTAFRDLLSKLSAHLHDTGAYAALSMLKLSGITTTTDELRLPAVDTCASAASDVTLQTWQSLGYTPGQVRSAWDSMMHAYLGQFPDKSFNIGFIGINAFPGIRSNGTIAPTAAERASLSANFAATLISDSGSLMPGRLAVGFDSLTLNIPADDTSYASSKTAFMEDAANAGARLGWQTNELLGAWPGQGAACGGSSKANAQPCTNPAEFRAMLFAGIYPNGKGHATPGTTAMYLELFPQNVNTYPGEVRNADESLIE